MSDFATSIEEIDDKEFDNLFAPAPKGTEKKEEKAEPEKKDPPPPVKNVTEIEEVEDEDLDESDPKKEEEDEEIEDEKPPVKKPAAKKEEKEEENPVPVDPNRSEIVRAHVEYLIEAGIWQDIEDKESIEWNDELFAEAVKMQDEARVNEAFNNQVEKTGVYGKEIIKFVSNGGNPEELLKLFEKQKEFKALDITTLDGQKEAVENYYTDVLGWDKKRTKKHIERLELDEAIEEEAQYVKGEYDKHAAAQIREKQAAQEAKKVQEEEDWQTFTSELNSVVSKRDDLNDKEKKQLISRVTDYNVTLKDGRKVNQFWVDFNKVQNDPESYMKLVEFCKDPNKYDVKNEETVIKKKAKATIKFLSSNATANKKTTNQAKVNRNQNSGGELNW